MLARTSGREPRRAAVVPSRSPVVASTSSTPVTARVERTGIVGPPTKRGVARSSYYLGMSVGDSSFDRYQLSDEHIALRAAVRQLAEEKIAPRAAEIDEQAQFPHDVYDQLVRAGFHAVHIPQQYGGAGADAIATNIVIEEVARACASSALIP